MASISRRDMIIGGAALSWRSRLLRVFGLSSFLRDNPSSAPALTRGTTIAEKSAETPVSGPAVEQKVNELLEQMTLDEKVAQLCSLMIGPSDSSHPDEEVYNAQSLRDQIGSAGIGFISRSIKDMDAKSGAEFTNLIQRIAVETTRLGIPPIIDGEGLRGLRANGSCVFPTSIAMGATWDPELVHATAVVVGQEAKSRGVQRILGPVLDLGRDPRHGRTEETYSEDAFLASRLGVAFVTGLQSQGVIATPKHFVANFVGEGGRDSGDIELSERALRETYLAPFKAAVEEGGALSLMCAYNSVNGIPCVLNSWLLTDVLRKEWKFQGIVSSDWGAIADSINYLHAAASIGDAARHALSAGTDVEAPKPDLYSRSLAEEVRKGRCDQAILDESVRRVLRLKCSLGLFDQRYDDPGVVTTIADAPAHRETALNVARKSIVLLKNEHSVLPLRTSYRSIAVIGPNANLVRMGGYAPQSFDAVTPLKALQDHLKNATVHYAKGCDITGDSTEGFREAVSAAEESEIVLLFLGGSSETAAEEMDRADLDLTGVQEALLHEIAAIGKPIVAVLIAGGPITMSKWIGKASGILMAWYAGEEGGNAIAEILTGICNPSGHLPITFPQFTGQLPMPYDHRPYGRAGTTLEVGVNLDHDRYDPQFPFGYGLSYTTFSYSDLSVIPTQISRDGTVRVSVTITNTGPYHGEDVVQLYLSNDECRITQPVKRLCAFKRVGLAQGASATITFILGKNDIAFLNENLKPEVNVGMYSLLAGGDCREGLACSFEVIEVGYGDPYA